jgi:uncharacterized membrane protein
VALAVAQSQSPLWGFLFFLVLGGVFSYGVRGNASGAPADSFAGYLVRNFWAESWIFLVGGLVTTSLYWLLARSCRAKAQAD